MQEDLTHLVKEDVCLSRNDIESLPQALGGARNLDVQRQDLRQLKLAGACLIGANLQEADLRGANLWGADLCQANLREANLSGARLSGAKLRGSDLSGADLSWTDLSGADLRGANLQQGNMRHANLSWADLRGARLEGIDLWDADLCGIELTEGQKVYLLQEGQDQLLRWYPPSSKRGLLAAPRQRLISGLFLALALLTTILVRSASVPLASFGVIVWLLLIGVTLWPWRIRKVG